MPEEIDSNTSGKKRRVIHWNPDADAAPDGRRWTWKRVVLWSVGGFFGLLIVAGVVIRVAKLVLGPDIFTPHAQTAEAQAAEKDPSAAFVTQSKAEFTYENVKKALAEIRKMPQEHPTQREKLI